LRQPLADGDLSPDDGRGDNEKSSLYENLRFLFSYRGHYIDYLSITETYLAENNFTEALTTLYQIYKQFEITEDQIAELQGLEFYTHWLQQLEKEQNNIYNLSEREINYLLNYVKTHTGRGVVFANNILCELYGIRLEEKGEVRKEKGEKENGENHDKQLNLRKSVQSADNITLHPNPTTGELSVVSYQLSVERIDIFDVYGRNVGAYPCGRPETTINIAHLQAGVYFVKITTEQGETIKKVIKR